MKLSKLVQDMGLHIDQRRAGFEHLGSDVHIAAHCGDVRWMLATLQERGGLNTTNLYGHTPLHEAVLANQLTAVRRLMTCSGIALNIKDENNATPLHLASLNHYQEIEQALREAGASEE
jgi:ankyrin repeat protein